MKGKQNENAVFDLLSDGKKQIKKNSFCCLKKMDENNQEFCTVKS